MFNSGPSFTLRTLLPVDPDETPALGAGDDRALARSSRARAAELTVGVVSTVSMRVKAMRRLGSSAVEVSATSINVSLVGAGSPVWATTVPANATAIATIIFFMACGFGSTRANVDTKPNGVLVENNDQPQRKIPYGGYFTNGDAGEHSYGTTLPP